MAWAYSIPHLCLRPLILGALALSHSNSQKTAANTLYRTLWRWHFYAGLLCIPFIISLSITGAIYLFKPQIENWINRDYQNLAISGQRTSPAEQIAAALKTQPNAQFASYRIPEGNAHAVVITLKAQGKTTLVTINPYDLTVLKSINKNDQFIRIVRTLHGELMLGNFGSVVIELAGCWAIVMVVTGLYLWWPRNAAGLAGIIYPRLTQGHRKFWRDIHAVTGFWLAFFTLFLLISGLPWALVWGSAFKELRSLGQPTAIQQDWEISQPLMATTNNWENNFTPLLLQKAEQLKFAPPVEISPDNKSPQYWKVSSGHQNRMLRADAWFDGQTHKLIKQQHFSDKKNIDKAIGIGIAAHEGHLFGWANQLLGLVVTLGLILVSISGFILWRKRKPESVLGAPPILPNTQVSKTVLLIILVLAVLLPVLAMSLIVLFVLEKWVFRKIKPVSLWLGLSKS